MFYLLNGTKVDRLPYSNGSDSSLAPCPGQHSGYSVGILQVLRGIVPRGACSTWPADYAYGYNGSYRRGLPQPIAGPSACVLKVWWAVARTHRISLQTVNSPYLCPTRWWRTACMVEQEYLRVFWLPSSLFGGGKRFLTMHWLLYQDSTLAVSVSQQGGEELR